MYVYFILDEPAIKIGPEYITFPLLGTDYNAHKLKYDKCMQLRYRYSYTNSYNVLKHAY